MSGALILEPRIGKYGKDGKPRAIPGHNMSLAVIGLFVLWLGWFGFNPGSTMSFQNPPDVMHILMATNTSAIAAVITSTEVVWIFLGKPDLGMTVSHVVGCGVQKGKLEYYRSAPVETNLLPKVQVVKVRTGTHCGGVELCRECDPPQDLVDLT